MEQWRLFHTDLQELTAWLDTADTKLAAAKATDDVTAREAMLVVGRHATIHQSSCHKADEQSVMMKQEQVTIVLFADEVYGLSHVDSC
ncbi:hypothetical protein BaRGS_00025452 [Batillaria attramentaria]|uniref:Uncharacterized protein n=1 Tax=Batillaria attramentaria TaxID=370345 RepID=A0ABD0K849_9CAEN